MLGAAVAEARAQLKVAERDADDLPTTEHRTDEHATIGPEPELEAEPTVPDGRVNLADLHRMKQFGADIPAPVTVPGTRRRMTPQPDED
jgi:hypothetical protein